ncbi:MAG TPA: PEGA domain-containing protein [Myxococcales bacterium LLY-WYZ-16_1]|nr:PEGA domain-containing protein [Myxococcales bacterium LLY-WYZ-16_1]
MRGFIGRALLAAALSFLAAPGFAAPSGVEAGETGRKGGADRVPRLFMMPIEASAETEQDMAEALQVQVAEVVQQFPQFVLVTKQDVVDMVRAQRTATALNCEDDEECLARIEERTDADLLLTGSLGAVGESYLVTFSLLNPKTSEVIRRVGASVADMGELGTRLPEILSEVLGTEAQSRVQFELAKDDVSFAVFKLASTGVDGETVQNLAQFLTVELSKIRGAQVISPQDIASILGVDRMQKMLGDQCDDECMINLSGALNVNYIVVGQVGQLDRDFVLALRLIDPREVKVENRVAVTLRGPKEELTRAIRTLARRLVGVDSEVPGRLTVTGPVSGGKVLLDGEEVGNMPAKLDAELPARRASVRVMQDGYYEWESDVFIQPGEQNVVWADLERKPDPVTKKWWFWTLVAAGVGGGVTTAVVLTQDTPNSGPITVLVD